MLNLSKIANISIRFCSKVATNTILEPLNTRSLLQVRGNEAQEFLQGLITNDINHLNLNDGGSMYTMFLNTKGRVLYDSIIYKNDDNYLIECDSEIEMQLEKHLKMYRVKKKIDIISLKDEYQIHALFQSFNIKSLIEQSGYAPKQTIEADTPQISVPLQLLLFKDPRVSDLGCRIISKVDVDVQKELVLSFEIGLPSSTQNYRLLRHYLGVGEGIHELPVGNCFPLESNCDYLHGVSFHKGCYIGQELTARTHHTGVIRKRLMPLLFTEVPTNLCDHIIKSEKVNLGKVRSVEQNFGLALLRVEAALELGKFEVGDQMAKVWKPHWWPLELQKEKLNVQKV